ncbi:hypothetical protein DFJ73DRAFT_508565 [Zopfochytrium polystomum]|nr:hypothetical protein DFJ73DRAFT_508565 [Zopfochytrium polystomum]
MVPVEGHGFELAWRFFVSSPSLTLSLCRASTTTSHLMTICIQKGGQKSNVHNLSNSTPDLADSETEEEEDGSASGCRVGVEADDAAGLGGMDDDEEAVDAMDELDADQNENSLDLNHDERPLVVPTSAPPPAARDGCCCCVAGVADIGGAENLGGGSKKTDLCPRTPC